ncbi:MAG: hemerythrin domain-containing protein [Sphaerochaetaceae bacterium]|nr:hemerythrin domain-containing protein [Spirochaetales bacterium]MDY5500543.1 hemerythrin domain-containing protein [Sphaerochaetaceae bacterium]
MHWTTECMMEEHANINRMLDVVERECVAVLDGKAIDPSFWEQAIAFIRLYSDKHHHGKEEQFLFPVMVRKLGRVGETMVTHGMLVEHDLGRSHVKDLEASLNQWKEKPTTLAKLGILANAMAYVKLLRLHTAKENNVVYTFAERMLDAESWKEIDAAAKAFETDPKNLQVKETYLALLARFEGQ